MSSVAKKLLQIQPSGGGAAATYVEDVFSTYLYAGTGYAQSINNGLDLGAYPFVKIASTDGNSVSGSETFTVNVKADTKLVVFILDSDNALPTCTVDGSSLTAATSSSNSGGGYHDSAVFIETLTAGFHTIVTSDTALGHTEVMLFDPNATVSVHTNLGVTTSSATSVTTSAVTTDGFCVFLGSDRDTGANFSCNQTSTEYYEETHTYFNFGAIGINGSSGTVPAATISGMVGTYPTNWCLLKVEGVGNDPTANSAASGEGGLVWIKGRDGARSHSLHDTERGVTKRLDTSQNYAESTISAGTGLNDFNSSGFTLAGTGNGWNKSGEGYCSWTFRKQPGFFDIVTYTGNNTARTISHNLGSAPGMIIIKPLNTAGDWHVFHRGADYNGGNANQTLLRLNSTAGTGSFGNSTTYWNDTDPTSTHFSLGSGNDTNMNNINYVAYLFAHDAQDFGENEDESIIYCGTYEGNGSTKEVTLGWEPQWILSKNIDDGSNNWMMCDTMRGAPVEGDTEFFEANTSDAEAVGSGSGNKKWWPTATGFTVSVGGGGANDPNENGETYVYVAIRRPHKPASEFAATYLFSIDGSGSATNPVYESNDHVVDMTIQKRLSYTDAPVFFSRLTGVKYLNSTSTVAEATGTNIAWDYMDGVVNSFGATTWAAWMFRRAPGFFDVVAYTGQSAEMEISHNLGVTPELIIQKCRTQGSGYNWNSWYTGLTNSQYVNLNSNAQISSSSNLWGTNSTVATDSIFRVGAATTGVNGGSSNTHIAYLFASTEGISKIGTFTRTSGDTTNVDCGFSNGARFVLWKRVSGGTGNWTVYDTVRGIVAGNDPYFFLNSTAASVTNTDYIDPYSAGFTVASGIATGTFFFLAIA